MDFIFFAEDWERHPSTAQFIAQELLKTHRILWVESLGLRRPHLSIEDFSRIIKKITQATKKPHSFTEGLSVVTPLVLPYHSASCIRRLNNLLLKKLIRNVIHKQSFKDYALVVACPAAEGMVGELGEVTSVYYCADEYSVFPGMDKDLVKKLENRIFEKVDQVITTSQNLRNKKSKQHPCVHFLPHGVQFEHFARCQDSQLEIPHEIQSIPRPIIGYHGLIQDLIDFPLIEALASAHPDWSFVFLGDIIFDIKELPKLPNIYYIGRKSFHDLPSYIKGFDVGLIPYRIETRTICANPVKLREYLASGKPVISTPLPEVFPYKEVVCIAETAEEFEKSIKQAIETDDPLKIKKRMNLVAAEDWGAIARKFELLVSVGKKIDPFFL